MLCVFVRGYYRRTEGLVNTAQYYTAWNVDVLFVHWKAGINTLMFA